MLPEFYRSFETHTLLDLVSYGDPEYEEPEIEEPTPREDGASSRRKAFVRPRRAWVLLGSKRRSWMRLGRKWIARTGARRS